MSKIGKAIFVSGGMHFAFTLTVGGTTYSFDEKSESSSVSGVYDYSRTKQGNVDKWSLVIYASGTITFSKLKHRIDYCVVGGGGGGGGGSCGGSGITQHGYHGGLGGGGYYNEQKTKVLSLNTAYTITIGAGGGGGAPGPGSRGAAGGAGGDGDPTSFAGLTAAGGDGGGGAYDGGSYHGGDGGGGDEKHCFNDDSMPVVSGKGKGQQVYSPNRGGGGGYGYYNRDPYGDPSSQWGVSGTAGVVVIRSTPKE